MKQAKIQDITGLSRKSISAVIAGKIEKVSPSVAEKILGLWNFEKTLTQLFSDEKFYEMCEIALQHAPKNKKGNELKIFTVTCMQASLSARRNLKQ